MKNNLRNKRIPIYRIWSLLFFLMVLPGKTWSQVNYVTWNFNTSISNANYSTSTTNQNAARSTSLTNPTLSTIAIVGTGVSGTNANTLHRTTGWPTAQDNAKYLEFSVTLASGQTFQNATMNLGIAAGVSSITTAARNYQVQYGWGASPTFTAVAGTNVANATPTSGGTVTTLLTTQTTNNATIPAPGNTTTTVLKIRLVGYGTTSSSGNIQYGSIALTAATGPIVPVAPTVSTTAVSSIATTSATFAGNVTATGGANISGNGTVYSQTSLNSNPAIGGGNVTNLTTDSPGSGTGTFSKGTGNVLLVNTQYTYNAYAINSAGTSYGTAANFYTLANTPNAPTIGVATSSTLPVTIDNTDGNPSATQYAIEINSSSNYVQANGSASGGAVWQTAATWGTVIVSGLAPNTIYNFRVYARNGDGTVTSPGANASKSTLSAATPSLTLSSLPSFGNVCTNSFATGSFTVSGDNLDDSDLSITSGSSELTFSASENGTYVTNLPIVYNGTSLATTTVWVKFIPTASGGFNGIINIAGGNTSGYTVSASGTGITPVAQDVDTDPVSTVVNTTATLNGNLVALGVCLSTTEKGFVYAQTGLNANPIVNGASVTKTSVAGLTTGTFNLPVSGLLPATSYTYKAYAFDGVNYTYGDPVVFSTLGAATHLFFSVDPPATGTVNNNLTSFTVQALRADNSVDTEYNTPISIAKATGPGNLTASASTSNGVAVFTNAKFDAVGTYTISASSGTLPTITNSVNIVISLPNATAVVWAGAASCVSGSSTTWLTAANWCGAAIPSGTTVAQFGLSGSASAIGFNMNGATVAQKTVGAIEITSASAARTIQNSSTTVAGDLTLNGVVVNGISNVILRSASANTLTIKRDATSFNLGLALGNSTNNIVNTDNTGGIVITAIISGAGKALTKSGIGSGALTLSGINTYTGATTIEAGTLTLGTANALPVTASAGDIRFTAGTPVLNLGDFNLGTATTAAASAGQLDFDVNATVNLGSGNRSYYFKASNTQTWSATAITVNNWIGTAGAAAGANNPKIFVGGSNSGLTSQQLAKIHFTGFPNGAKLLASGELVPMTLPPSITSIPAAGCAGSSIVINGTNLANAISVTIGGTPATITANTDTAITVTVGSGTTGTISVTTDGGTAVSVDTFSVNPGTTYYSDTVDNDGYGDPAVSQISCTGAPAGYVSNNTDCDPLTSNYRLGNFYVDADNDGYYNGDPQTVAICYGTNTPSGYTPSILGTDCNDSNSQINANHVEVLGNGIDDNCDGSIDEVAPTSSLQPSQCGLTLTNIAQAIYANQVQGAEGYRFEVTNGANVRSYDSATSNFNLMNLSGGATYATTYSIRVAVKTSGFWRAYSTACNITTPAVPETTNITNAQCGSTLTDIANTIYCGQVTSATQYRFEVSDGSTIRTLDSAVNRFSLTSLSGGANYATTYAIRVALMIGGVWQDYGASCNITTPLTPGTSNVTPSQCGITISNSWTTIYATQVAAASGYRFIVSDGTSTRFFDTPNARFNLHNLAGAAPAPSTTYTISVSILYNSVYLAAGPSCTITTAATITRQAVSSVAIFDAKAYPNPFANNFKIDLNTSSESKVVVKVYDMIGRQIDAREFSVNDILDTDLGDQYPSGVYNIVITQGENVKTLRVIKR